MTDTITYSYRSPKLTVRMLDSDSSLDFLMKLLLMDAENFIAIPKKSSQAHSPEKVGQEIFLTPYEKGDIPVAALNDRLLVSERGQYLILPSSDSNNELEIPEEYATHFIKPGFFPSE